MPGGDEAGAHRFAAVCDNPISRAIAPVRGVAREAARRAAEEPLLDRALMVVSPEAYGEFLKRLDRPPQPNDRLRRTMRSKAPWQTG